MPEPEQLEYWRRHPLGKGTFEICVIKASGKSLDAWTLSNARLEVSRESTEAPLEATRSSNVRNDNVGVGSHQLHSSGARQKNIT